MVVVDKVKIALPLNAVRFNPRIREKFTPLKSSLFFPQTILSINLPLKNSAPVYSPTKHSLTDNIKKKKEYK